MKQLGLLFQSHSPTSLAAAIAYADSAPNARRRVFDLLERLAPEGLTDEQMQDALRMSSNTQRPRRVELERAGLVVDSGRTRATHAKQQAVIWTVTGLPYPDRWMKRKDTPL
jgi:hypothetical protein